MPQDVPSGVKMAHDWAVEQLADLFRTTQRVKTQQVAKSWGQRCGVIELAPYLSNATGPVLLVMDLCITHKRWGSSSNPSLHDHSHYPTDIDRTLNWSADDKNLKYRPHSKTCSSRCKEGGIGGLTPGPGRKSA